MNRIPIIQITSKIKNIKRFNHLKNHIVKTCIESTGGEYFLVSPENDELEQSVNNFGGSFIHYDGWEKDMSRKWRIGLDAYKQSKSKSDWVCLLADDMCPDNDWQQSMSSFLASQPEGQYGFRLTDENSQRHEHGEDWMQYPNRKLNLPHRPLRYDTETGDYEDSPTAYVAACVVHRNVVDFIEPFGIFGAAPDVMWSLAIRQCGYKIGFNPKARVYHVGDRRDNR